MVTKVIPSNFKQEDWLDYLTRNNNLCTGMLLNAIKLIYSSKEIVSMLNSKHYNGMTYRFDSIPSLGINQVETYYAVDIGRGFGEMSILLQDISWTGELSVRLRMSNMPNNSLEPIMRIVKMADTKDIVVNFNSGLEFTAKGERGLKSILNMLNSIKVSYELDVPTYKRIFNHPNS